MRSKTKIALLGDSIFDNAAYVDGGIDVHCHLQELLPAGASAILLARDGATIDGAMSQIARLPDDITHVILSVGGNDALNALGEFDVGVATVADEDDPNRWTANRGS